MVAHPDIGKPGTAACLAYLLLKGVALACWIAFRRTLLAKHRAQIAKVRLSAGALGLRVDLPAMNELGNCQRHGRMCSLQPRLGGKLCETNRLC